MADFRVVLLAGEEYAARPAVASFLLSEYGDAESGGMLLRRESLRAVESLPEGSIILLLGASDSVVRDLVRLRDSVERLRVVSLFCDGDVLPLEEACDIVVDLAVTGDLLADERTTAPSTLPDAELGFLLYTAALAFDVDGFDAKPPAEKRPSALLADALVRARSYAKNRTAGASWSFAPFSDPETGLRSANHMLFSSVSPGASVP